MIKKKHNGSSLIEVLITLIVMAVGLLGLASMQMISIKNINNSQFRSLATDYAYDMAERMRANSVGVAAGNYVAIDTNGASSTTCSPCSSAQMARVDQFEWAQMMTQSIVSGGLPSGRGTVSGAVATGVYDINIQWDEQGRNDTGGTVETAQLILTIRL